MVPLLPQTDGSIILSRWRQVTADPQIKPTDLSCKSTDRLPVLSSTLTVVIYYYYSVQRLILIYHPTKAKRLS